MGPSGQINITTYTYLTVVIRVEGGSESATWVSQTVPDNSVRTAGQSFTNTWTIRNTGTTTWGAGYYLQHVSGSFCGTGTVPVSGTVAPNATTSLTVSCTAPTATGTHTHTYRLMGPSGQISIATYTYLTVVIRVEGGSESATWVSQTVPDNSVRTAGQSFTNNWTIRNTGTTTWGAGYYLQHVSGSFCGTGTLPVSGSVVPNATTSLTVSCTAPTATGTHTHTYRLMGPSGQINIATYTYLTVVIRVEAGSESATWVSQTVPDNSVRTAGQSFTNTWTIRNTGTTTWGAGYYLQHVSGSFCGTGTLPVSGSVAPNATTTLTVNCTAPTATGTHTHTYRLMGPSGQINIATYTYLTVVIRVEAGSESATWVSQTVPDNSVRTAGQSFTNTWTIRNTGTTTWGAGYYLQHVSGSFCGTGTVPVSGTVAPNATTTLTVSCTAPTTTGSHTHTYRLMGPSGQINIATYTYLTVVIRVEGGSESATWVSQTVPDNSVRTAGQNFTNTWTIRNTGTTTWGAGYYLQHVSGSYCGTGTVPVSGTVAPNATTTLTVNCTAPTATGTHTHTYRLVGPSGQINIATYTYLTVVIRVGNASAPMISGISPAMPLATTQVQSVRVTGSGFLPGLTVQLFAQETLIAQLNGTAIQDLTSMAFSVSINFQGRAGTYDLRVSNPGDPISSNPFRFVVNPVSTPQFILSESRIDFQMIEGACSPPSKAVMLSTSRDNVRFSISTDGPAGTSWLRVTPTSGQTPTTLQFSVTDGTPPKEYSATVRIRSSGAIENTFSIPVTLRVVPAGGAISGIEMIDPLESEGSSLVDSEARIPNNPSALARDGRVVGGVAADGVARVVIRIPATREGERFTISFRDPCQAQSGTSNPDEDGTFLPVGEEPKASGTSSLTVAAQMANGRPMAFAVYRAPIDFVRTSNLGDRSSRERELEILVYSESGAKGLFNGKIVRPPVLLVHGLNSDAKTWDYFCLRDDKSATYQDLCAQPLSGFLAAYKFDYANTSSDSVSDNAVDLSQFQRILFKFIRKRDQIALSQMDVVAHSMGGLLARQAATHGSYRSKDNYKEGNIHKLITISTPHQGSRFADRIVDASLVCRGIFKLAGLSGEAYRDLRPGSRTLRFVNQAPIRSHLIAGIASQYQTSTNELTLASMVFGKACSLIPFGGYAKLHGGESDLIVTLESQLHMESWSSNSQATSRFDGYIHSVHKLLFPIGPDVLGRVVQSPTTDLGGVQTEVVSRVIYLLNSSVTNQSLFSLLEGDK
jgi:pimeloyl-ACP methyl ester carboxylesterase